jgi:ribosomal protein L10
VDALSENLTGPTAIAFGFEQPAAPVEVLTEFARTHEKCQIKPLGLIGTYPAPLDAIKTLRGRDELLGEFVALLSAPMGLVYQTLTNLGRTPLTTLMSLGQSPLGLLQGLSALKEQEQSA